MAAGGLWQTPLKLQGSTSPPPHSGYQFVQPQPLHSIALATTFATQIQRAAHAAGMCTACGATVRCVCRQVPAGAALLLLSP